MARLLLVRVGWGKLRFGKGVEVFFNEPRRREGREGGEEGEEGGRFTFDLVSCWASKLYFWAGKIPHKNLIEVDCKI